jgi:hypothetical protein
MVFLIFHVVRDEVLLDVHHSRATGVVQEASPGKAGGTARVTFSPDPYGPVTATVQLSIFHDLPRVGDRIEVEYDPSQPHRARRAGAHDVAAFGPFIAVIVAVGFVWGRGDRWRRRKAHRLR